MWRKVLLLLGVLVLGLATISPAFADPKPKNDKAKGPPEGVPAATQVAAGLQIANGAPGKAYQGKITAIDGTDKYKWTINGEKYGDLKVNVANAVINWPGRKNATYVSFAVGDRVVVQLANKTTGTDEYQSARRVHLVPGSQFIHFTGELLGAGGDRLRVRNAAGVEIEFAADPNTAGTSVKWGPQLWLLKDFGISRLDSEWKGKMVTVVARDWTSPKFATAIVLHGNQAGLTERVAFDDDDEDDDGSSQTGAPGKGKAQAPGQIKKQD